MLLTDARRPARTGQNGELIPLDEQDRALWNREQIVEGAALVANAFARGAVGYYQLQAAVAALHDEAPSTEATDWAQIAQLYELLEDMTGNPMIKLNRAVAVGMVAGPAQALVLLDEVGRDERMAGHYRLDAVRAHMLEKSGEHAGAIRCYRRAAERTNSIPERNYLLLKAARLSESPASRA